MDLDRTNSVTATTAGRPMKEEREIKKHKIRCNFNQGLEFKAKVLYVFFTFVFIIVIPNPRQTSIE
jgi:hypothetical protein